MAVLGLYLLRYTALGLTPPPRSLSDVPGKCHDMFKMQHKHFNQVALKILVFMSGCRRRDCDLWLRCNDSHELQGGPR